MPDREDKPVGGGIIVYKNPYNSNLALLCNNTQTAEGGITEGLLSLNRMLQLAPLEQMIWNSTFFWCSDVG